MTTTAARLAVGHAYEKALFAGNRQSVADCFTEEITYWVAGQRPLGGEWHGRENVLNALFNREPGLGAADWDYQELARDWYTAEDRVIVEIRERSWLKSHPEDVMDQRTCAVLRFEGNLIAEMRDYTDSHSYEEFLKRHRAELPKFRDK